MNNKRDIELQRYKDGVPSVLRKKTVYTDLHFYRKSDTQESSPWQRNKKMIGGEEQESLEPLG